MVAVSLIFILSLSSLLLLRNILKQQEGYGTLINISGRQRMLSQQIALLAHEIVAERHGSPDPPLLLRQIDAALTLMQRSHRRLLQGLTDGNSRSIPLSATLAEMYYQPPLEVDRMVTEYIAAMKTLLGQAVSTESLEQLSRLSIHARKKLLPALDAVVQQYEAESNRYSAILKDSTLAILLLMLLLLLGIIRLGFRPMVRLIIENENMLNSILDSIPILMDIVSKDGTILYQSQFLINLLGKSTIGQRCFTTYSSNTTQCTSCPIKITDPPCSQKTNSSFKMLVAGIEVVTTHIPILFKGQDALLHTFQDITEQKKTESLLIKAKEASEHTSAMKSNFLANMSHEIKTPMNAILGFSELTLETELNLKQQGYLNKIQYSANSLLRIIDGILDFSKIDAGRVALVNRHFSLKELLDNLIFLYSDQARDKDITLKSHLPPEIPPLLVGDALRLQQILKNFLDNSLKFTDIGRITIQVELESHSPQGVFLKFSISDTGIGITTAQLRTLFDSFSQADSSRTRKYSGTGLGLAISKQLIELLGGQLAVSSRKRRGTVFSFSLPFSLPNDDLECPTLPFTTAPLSPRRSSSKTESCPSPASSLEDMLPLISELSLLLREKHFDAIARWSELRLRLPSQSAMEIQKIDDCIQKFEFSKAVPLITQLIEKLQDLSSTRMPR